MARNEILQWFLFHCPFALKCIPLKNMELFENARTCKVDEAWPWLYAYWEYSLRKGPRNLNAVPTVVCSMYSRSFWLTSQICSRLLKSLAWSFSGTRQLNRSGKSKNWNDKKYLKIVQQFSAVGQECNRKNLGIIG